MLSIPDRRTANRVWSSAVIGTVASTESPSQRQNVSSISPNLLRCKPVARVAVQVQNGWEGRRASFAHSLTSSGKHLRAAFSQPSRTQALAASLFLAIRRYRLFCWRGPCDSRRGGILAFGERPAVAGTGRNARGVARLLVLHLDTTTSRAEPRPRPAPWNTATRLMLINIARQYAGTSRRDRRH